VLKTPRLLQLPDLKCDESAAVLERCFQWLRASPVDLPATAGSPVLVPAADVLSQLAFGACPCLCLPVVFARSRLAIVFFCLHALLSSPLLIGLWRRACNVFPVDQRVGQGRSLLPVLQGSPLALAKQRGCCAVRIHQAQSAVVLFPFSHPRSCHRQLHRRRRRRSLSPTKPFRRQSCRPILYVLTLSQRWEICFVCFLSCADPR
jgi:hypothetical protein